MKEPMGTRYVPGYDLFKLIVAVILTVILIYLLLRESQQRFASIEAVETPLPTYALTSTETSLSTGTSAPPVSALTEIPPTTEAVVTPAPATEVSPTEASPVTTPEATPSVTTASPELDCPANPTRIKAGDKVRVLDWLNFRTGPGLSFEILTTNRPSTEMEVLDGPVCTVKGENPPRAYLWWNVRMGDGREGWSAEAPLNFPNYFLEPIR